MKVTTLIFIATMLLDPLPKKPPTLKYFGEDVTLKEIFAVIKNQTGVVFFYDVDLMKDAKPFTVDLDNLNLEQALNEIFMNQPLAWAMEGRTVTIYKR